MKPESFVLVALSIAASAVPVERREEGTVTATSNEDAIRTCRRIGDGSSCGVVVRSTKSVTQEGHSLEVGAEIQQAAQPPPARGGGNHNLKGNNKPQPPQQQHKNNNAKPGGLGSPNQAWNADPKTTDGSLGTWAVPTWAANTPAAIPNVWPSDPEPTWGSPTWGSPTWAKSTSAVEAPPAAQTWALPSWGSEPSPSQLGPQGELAPAWGTLPNLEDGTKQYGSGPGQTFITIIINPTVATTMQPPIPQRTEMPSNIEPPKSPEKRPKPAVLNDPASSSSNEGGSNIPLSEIPTTKEIEDKETGWIGGFLIPKIEDSQVLPLSDQATPASSSTKPNSTSRETSTPAETTQESAWKPAVSQMASLASTTVQNVVATASTQTASLNPSQSDIEPPVIFDPGQRWSR